jgi:hypothetical protein
MIFRRPDAGQSEEMVQLGPGRFDSKKHDICTPCEFETRRKPGIKWNARETKV